MFLLITIAILVVIVLWALLSMSVNDLFFGASPLAMLLLAYPAVMAILWLRNLV
jgi:hypothetical protein